MEPEFSNSAKMKYYYNHKTGKRYWRDDKDPEGYAFRPLPNKERETFHVLAAKDALSPASKQKQKDTVADAGSTPSNKASATDALEDGEILEEGEIVEDSSDAAQTNPTDLETQGKYHQSTKTNTVIVKGVGQRIHRMVFMNKVTTIILAIEKATLGQHSAWLR